MRKGWSLHDLDLPGGTYRVIGTRALLRSILAVGGLGPFVGNCWSLVGLTIAVASGPSTGSAWRTGPSWQNPGDDYRNYEVTHTGLVPRT